MQQSLRFLPFTFLLVLAIYTVSAAPVLTINSPENVTYGVNKILVNVTSNELVDFYLVDRRGAKQLMEENSYEFETFVYVKTGSYEFEIYANNSNGEDIVSVIYSTNKSNPINVASCGILRSSDTEYVLGTDLISTSFECLQLRDVRNSTLDLNGYTIDAGNGRYGLVLWFLSDVEVFNGTVKGSHTAISNAYPWVVRLYGTKILIENVTIEGFVGFELESIKSSVIKNVSINSTVGFYSFDAFDLHLLETNITWNGGDTLISWWEPSGFFDVSSSQSKVILEESEIINFPEYDFMLQGSFSDFYLRTSHPDLSKVFYPDWTADARFFTQYLVIVNVKDQLGLTGASSVRVKGNGVIPKKSGLVAELETLENPTGEIFMPTEETGKGQEWITEKLTYAKSDSPAVIEEYEFSNYTLTARGWGNNESTNTTLDLTELNSTIELDFVVNTDVGESLSQCTISEMLDLNGDSSINIQDAVIILRHISGLPVSTDNGKNCEGINLNAF